MARTRRSSSTNSNTGVRRTNTRTVKNNGSSNLTQSSSTRNGLSRYTTSRSSDGITKVVKTTWIGNYFTRKTISSIDSRPSVPTIRRQKTTPYKKWTIKTPAAMRQKSHPVTTKKYEYSKGIMLPSSVSWFLVACFIIWVIAV